MKGYCNDCKEEIDETEQNNGYCEHCFTIHKYKELADKIEANYKKFGELIDGVAIPYNLHGYILTINDETEKLIKGLKNWR